MELEYVIFDLSGKLSISRYYFRVKCLQHIVRSKVGRKTGELAIIPFN